MSAIILLIGFSLALAIGFLISFIYSVKSGQFDDTYTPSVRILHDDIITDTKPSNSKSTSDGNAKV